MKLPSYPGPRLEMAIERSAAALESLVPAVEGLVSHAPIDMLESARARSFFRPAEEDELVDYFARFLSVRAGLWEVLSELAAVRDGDLAFFFSDGAFSSDQSDEQGEGLDRRRGFVIGYAAACSVVQLDRFLLEKLATDSMVQRKLNQGFAERRIPRKMYTSIFESFTDPQTALLLDEAIETRRRHGEPLERLRDDALLGELLDRLPWLESALDRSRRRFLRLFLRFQEHALRRRAATIRDHGFFHVMESSGRFASEIRDRWQDKHVSPEIIRRLAEILRPGDVLVTRHRTALTNLFLPGFWPHSALYVGTEDDRRRLGVELDDERRRLWSGPRCVLEALKDGVRFRPLEETLAVDAVAVIRPRLEEKTIAEALSRVARHEGKGYNFDFDFFRSDRLVCTEVVYRAFDGLDDLHLPLSERAGRPTLSAEDLLDLALDTPHFEAIAVYGAPPSPDILAEGPDAAEALRASYRPAG